jgi:hypothetical protein
VMPISSCSLHLDGNPTHLPSKNPYGPWDDTLCYFPGNMVEQDGVW